MKTKEKMNTKAPTHWVGFVAGNINGNFDAWATTYFRGDLDECEKYLADNAAKHSDDCGGGLMLFEYDWE